MTRDTFLARIRDSAAAGRGHRVHVRQDIPAGVGYVGAGADPVARMAHEVDAVGGRAYVVDGRPAARDALKRIIELHRPLAALCWECESLDRLGLEEFLGELAVEHLSYTQLHRRGAEECRRTMLAAHIGITGVSYAIAETGTLAVASGAGSERSASLLPPSHVAIVEESQILPDLFDLFAELDRRGLNELPTNLALITGPSKTGDIELRLTTGVHGPGELHVILIRGT